MKHNSEITADQVLSVNRPAICVLLPVEADDIQTMTAPHVVEAFRERFGRAHNSGVWKRLSNIVVEPANPFESKTRRRVRQEAIVLGTLVCAAIAFTAYFNLSATLR